MFINHSDNPIPTLRTDGYNRVSLILCTIGILVTGVVSLFVEYITLVSGTIGPKNVIRSKDMLNFQKQTTCYHFKNKCFINFVRVSMSECLYTPNR